MSAVSEDVPLVEFMCLVFTCMPVRVNVGDSASFIVTRYRGRGLQVISHKIAEWLCVDRLQCRSSDLPLCCLAHCWPVVDQLFCGWPVADQFVLWLASGRSVCFVAGQWLISFCVASGR